MFRFNNWTLNTCNDLPECGQECHDLNVCSDNSTYIDRSGITRYIFATYDADWNLTCMSGISCDQEVYDKPPKYNRHYAPCCWTVSVVGGSGTGTCGQSCEKNYSYTTRPSYLVDVSDDNTYADVYIKHNFYGYGTGRCNTPLDLDYDFYSDSGIIGRITDLDCGLRGSGLSCVLNNFIPKSSVPLLCNYDDIQVIYSGSYTREECATDLFLNISTDLDWTPCLDISTIIESGYPGCYTQNGDFIQLGDPYGNSYTVSLYEAINFTLDNFIVSGVTGLDDNIPLASALKSTCNECNSLNRTWYAGEWDNKIPYNPKAICCNCPETDMCLNRWSIDLAQPSAIITLSSYAHGATAKWLCSFPDSGCVINSSGGMWNFEYLWQAEPGSGDLPLDSGFWNRCDFSQSSIELNYTGNFTPTPSNSGTDCKEQIVEQPNGYCHICADRNGPDEFLVTVDLNFKKRPVYAGVNVYPGPRVSCDPPIYTSKTCENPVEEWCEGVSYIGDMYNGCIDNPFKLYNFNFIQDSSFDDCFCVTPAGRLHCYPYFDTTTLINYTDNVCCKPFCVAEVISINDCQCGPEIINGSWIVQKSRGSCTNDTTIREEGGQCPCTPCSSGIRPINSCTWSVPVDNDCLFSPTRTFSYPYSGQCPCGLGVCDAAGNCEYSQMSNECTGCDGFNYTYCSGDPIPRLYEQGTRENFYPPWFMGSDCKCCYNGPQVVLSTETVSGILKLRLSVIIPGLESAGSCGASASVLLDAGTDIINGYDCNGDPFFETLVDCSKPINHTFTIPSIAIYSEDPYNSGVFYTTSCYDGGTVTVESL